MQRCFPETLTAIYRTTEYFDWNFMGELHDHDLMRWQVTSIIVWHLFPLDWIRVSVGRQVVSVNRTCGTRSHSETNLFSHFWKLHRESPCDTVYRHIASPTNVERCWVLHFSDKLLCDANIGIALWTQHCSPKANRYKSFIFFQFRDKI